jgi:glycosyltransferase involved in cell wall biosynthesis
VDFFAERGFSRDRLVNLPVVLDKTGQDSDDASSRTAIRSRLRISDSTFLVVTGSRLTHDKGFDLLIEAVRLIPEEVRAGLKVVIVGQGEEAESLEGVITRSGLEDSVEIRPWLPEQDFRDLFIAADVVIHPARMDAYGGISLTALAEGRPLIGTREAGSARDIIRDGFNGWLYDAADTEELSRLIQRARQDPEAVQALAQNMKCVRDSEGRNPDDTAARLLANLV